MIMDKAKILGGILVSLPFAIYLCLMVTVYGLQDVLIAAGYVLGFLLMWFSLMLGIGLLTDGQD
jgi:glycopeptide antibiotics resistance protein